MSSSPYETDLSVTPPSYQMSAMASESFAFDAGEAITGATAVLVDRLTRSAAGTVSSSVAGQVCDATVSGLTFGDVYELIITFTNADGITWSRTLVIECVA